MTTQSIYLDPPPALADHFRLRLDYEVGEEEILGTVEPGIEICAKSAKLLFLEMEHKVGTEWKKLGRNMLEYIDVYPARNELMEAIGLKIAQALRAKALN